MLEINKIYQGDCLIKLKELEDNSVDSIVTDPPYELGFMGKSWDNTGIANNKEMWKECLRVLKPGGHLLAFSGTRTYHRMASAIEDAGFEIRDVIEWVYGSGFPKSLAIGKAIDKLQGNERKTFIRTDGKGTDSGSGCYNMNSGTCTMKKEFIDSKGTSEFEGWGTALKPAHEPICMARKPLSEKTVAENCLKYGTGGINIDESRVDYQGDADWNNTFRPSTNIDKNCWIKDKNAVARVDIINRNGRFPANLIHDGSEEVRECFPETKSGKAGIRTSDGFNDGIYGKGMGIKAGQSNGEFGDSGNASRFFKSIIYQAKASKSERNRGCEELELKEIYPQNNSIERKELNATANKRVQNNHPTVKPIALMEYLIKMVTPKGGIVLDPFAGSGTTLISAKLEGYSFIGIEMEPEYCKIAEERIRSLELE